MFKFKSKKSDMKNTILNSGLFDNIFYLKKYHDVRMSDLTPIDHYCQIGIEEDRKLNANFDPAWYREYYQDVKENGAYPLVHYILFGNKEGRFVNEIEKNKYEAVVEKTVVEETEKQIENFVFTKDVEFDSEFYLNTNLDVKEAGVDAYEHFINNGWKEGRNPNSWFDTQFYLDTYSDVKNSDENPFLHYKDFGKKEKRIMNPFMDIAQISKIFSNKYFDEIFYLTQYEDVRNSSMNPLYHYIISGYKEHRNPSSSFDTFYYMNKYNIESCPLIHYLENLENNTIPENTVIFDNSEKSTFKSNKKIAVQLHLFYMDVAGQLVKYLNNIPMQFDLLISVITESDKIYSENFFKKIKNVNTVNVKVVENIGRDISPLLVAFKRSWDEYDYICHIHSKRSSHTDFGDEWRTYLFDKLLGSENTIINVLEKFELDKEVSLIYPENFYKIKKFTMSDDNIEEINKVMRKLGLPEEDKYSQHPFSAGSMQWFRTESFRDLIELNFKYEDFTNTNTKVDGTLAHAMERIFSIFTHKKGCKVLSYYTESENKILVSESNQYSIRYNLGDVWMRDDPKISANISNEPLAMHNYFNKDSLIINWVIPDFGIGAGGHMTIFRMIYFLEKLGHRQTIWIQNSRNYKTPSIAKDIIINHYQPIGGNVDIQFLPDDTEWISGDIVIATDCWTAYPVRSMSKFKKRCYFIQDYEPMFHPMGENYLIAEQTYSFGFTAICAGSWLKKKAQDHGMVAYDFPLCADQNVYSVKPDNKYIVEGKINIAFYSRSYTPRRAVKLGFAGFSELTKTEKNIHVHCFGQDDLPVIPDFSYTNHGIMSPLELAELYNSCDIGVVFSATNYSLIPLEMIACGLPIVEMDVESTRYIFDENIVTFAQPNVTAIAQGIKNLINDKTKRKSQIAAGLEFLKDISWEKSANNINEALYKELQKDSYIALNIESITNSGFSPKTHATVVIPTLNAEVEISKLLNTLLLQETLFSFDILVIDSSSDDKTPEILNEYALKYENISFIIVDRKDFQHGKTRDMGIEKAKGDYVAFLTQDALPYNKKWLEELIKGFSIDDKIVGVFGKHAAYDEHSAFVKRDMKNHFNHFDMLPKMYSWSDAMPSHIHRGSLEWQMKMMFYSDNNSAISKKAWKSIPYPHVDWGEDQVWAWTIIQLGLKKYYAHNSIVYHSHDDTYKSRLKVTSIEKRFFYENFGIKFFISEEQAKNTKAGLDQQDKEFCAYSGINEKELKNQLLLNEASVIGRSGYENI